MTAVSAGEPMPAGEPERAEEIARTGAPDRQASGAEGVPEAVAATGAQAQSGSEPGPTDRSSPAGGTPPVRGSLIDWILVLLITLVTAWTGVVALAFLPLHIGAVPFPISALFGVAALILGPRAAYGLTGSMIAAGLPVAAWFGVSVWLVLARNPIMPGVPLTVIDGQWRVMLLLGLGSLAAAATLGLIWGDRLRDRLAAQRAAADARDLDPEPSIEA